MKIEAPLKVTVPVARGPLPGGDPRQWLSWEVVSAGASPLPTMVMAGGDSFRLVAGAPAPDAAWIASVDAALLEQEGVVWVGGVGTALLKREGGRVMASFARLRWVDGQVWLRLWLRIPGLAPSLEEAQTFSGEIDELPDWLQRLFPKPRGLEVVLKDIPWSDLRWQQRAGVRAPDDALPLQAGATLRDFALAAAHRLEARVVLTGQIGPSAVAWTGQGMSVWWGESIADIHRIGRSLARAASVRAAGLFGLGEDEASGGHVLVLAVESRAGERLLWSRRFTISDSGTARWTDSSGQFQEPSMTLGWYRD